MTIAGVLMATRVPLRHKLSTQELQQELRSVSSARGEFERVEMMLEHIDGVLRKARSPLHSMEHALAPYVAFFAMPVFAFFIAGVAVGGGESDRSAPCRSAPSSAMLIGKPIGVAGFAWLAVRSGLTRLPQGANWPGIIGIGLLAGIGFTMSLFIANLAFGPGAELDQAKIGVLAASVVAALVGLAFLSRALPRAAATAGDKQARAA